LVGDCNLDGAVNALDISCFVGCLTSGRWCGGCDVNGDGVCNALDISGFVRCLTGGACSGEADKAVVPESAAMAVLALALGATFIRRR
jgi:MYXO-CTERM domain-containing protein